MNRRGLLLAGGSAAVLAGAGAFAWMRATGSAGEYDAYTRRIRAVPEGPPGIADMLRYATLAANGHNTQPWRFAVADDAIRLFPDMARRTPVVDPDDHHLFVSLGCAAENLAIAGRVAGRPGEWAFEPGDGSAARFAFAPRFVFVDGGAVADPLFDAIPRRQCTRAEYDGRAIPAADLAALEQAGSEPGVRLVLLTDRTRIGRARELIVAGNDAQMADPAFMAELKQWIRFNPRSAMDTGDGLFSGATGNPALPTLLGPRAFDLFFDPGAETDRYARQVASSGALAVFIADKADPAHWMRVGRACQRFTLAATARGLKHAYVNQPVEVERLRPELAALAGEPGRRPDLVLRVGFGPTLPYSPRRPVAAVTRPSAAAR
ncbi:Tat pathway signal protein [Allostella vacuolata]|nr:Tat pathway signal protein [Stella vacuolata]